MTGEQLFAEAEAQLGCMRVCDALRFFDLAEQTNYNPDLCAAGRWTCHMLSGDFESAWRESDAITRRAKPDPNRFWDGRPLDGRKVLVRCLHGLGDTIQFIRYAPLIRKKAHLLAIEAQPGLKLLLAQCSIADQVFTWGEPEPAWDLQIEIIELPRIFRTTIDSIPSHVPYLDLSSVPSIRPYDGSRALKVGFVWSSSNFNPERSIPIERFASIFATRGVQFFALQAGPERTQLAPWSAGIIDLYDETACVFATAKVLKSLDLVITVDTMLAHLAGALGRPVWTLLPFQCDWRWMLDRENSPWYPTMRLFRQPSVADWDSVMERVQCELEALVALTKHLPDAPTARERFLAQEA